MREALKVKGKIEILQNKAKLLKDVSWTEGEEFEKLKSDISQFDEGIQKKLDQIKRYKLDWAKDDMEDGINVDEELSEEEIGQRFTRLRPEGQRPNN